MIAQRSDTRSSYCRLLFVIIAAWTVFGPAPISLVAADNDSDIFPAGTWINMRFIEELKAHKSVHGALSLIRPDELLVIRAVKQSDGVMLLFTSKNLDEGTPTDMAVSRVRGLGEQRRIQVFGKTWLLGLAKAKSEYIALHSTVDSSANPDVFAVIPSRNQDAGFIYQRVLNSATLSGTYVDAKGKTYSFSSLQHASFPNLEFDYRIVVVPDKPYQIIEVRSDKPKVARYAYEHKDGQLFISTIAKNGALNTLYKLTKRN